MSERAWPLDPALAALAASAVVLRLVVVWWLPTVPVSDFWSYLERSRLLVHEGTYGPFVGRPDASYPPAYPLLLTLAQLAPRHTLFVAKLLNATLGAVMTVLAGIAGGRLAGRGAGRIAAALAAFHPRYLLLTGILASENLFGPLLVLWLLIVVSGARRPRAFGLAVCAGVVLGVLALTRSVAYLLSPVWWVAGRTAGKRWRELVAELAIVVGAQHVVMLPWAVRNEVTLGRFAFLTSVGGTDLYIGNSDGATGDWYAWQPSLLRIAPDLADRTPFEADAVARRAAGAWIRHHPRQALELYFRKLRLMLLGDESYLVYYAVTGEGRAPPAPGKVPVLAGPHPLKDHASDLLRTLDLWHWALTAAALAGCGWLLVAVRRRTAPPAVRPWIAASLAAGAYFPLVTAVFLGSTRFRWPLEDIFLPMAAVALAAGWNGLARRSAGQPASG